MRGVRMSFPAYRLVFALAVALAAWRSAADQLPDTVTIRGDIRAVQSANEFDVAGYHVITPSDTQFVSFYGSKKDAVELRRCIEVGTYVEVSGLKDSSTHTVTAKKVLVHDDADRKISGFGVIDRMVTTGAGPVYYADGFALRVSPGTELRFSGGLTAMSEVGANIWVRYEGRRNDFGDLVLSSAEFIKPKPSKRKRNLLLEAQAVTFPPGSLVDFDGSFQSVRGKHRMEDAGGSCGWYPVPSDDALQERVRSIGMRVVPEYQRHLPLDDGAKIPFRFYAVDENDVRSDLFCKEGLVMVPVKVIERLKNDDQLAALLADGVAANLQRQQARMQFDRGLIGAAELAVQLVVQGSAGYAGGWAGGAIVTHEIQRKMERQRGRVALGLIADAGFDPWQAPEAWRLLGPGHLPKDLSKLKYPSRADYQLEILGLQYKARSSATGAAPAPDASATAPTQ